MISYFPTAGNLKKIFQYGDIITVNKMKITSTGTNSNYYSGNNLLSTTNYTFDAVASYATMIYLPECTLIGASTFYNNSVLTYISLPKCTTINSNAFCACANLEKIYAPNCTDIRSNAFYSCKKLQEAFFPNCTQMSSHAFSYCPSLSYINFPLCTSISTYAFRCSTSASSNAARTLLFSECTHIGAEAFVSNNINSMYFNKVIQIGSSAFSNCSINISDIWAFTSCETICYGAFEKCTFLSNTNIHFPVCTSVGQNAFAYANVAYLWFDICNSITRRAFADNTNLFGASFPELTVIQSEAFDGDSKLRLIYFPKCTTIENSAFRSTGISETVTFPLCTTIKANSFENAQLTAISFPKITTIGSYAFKGCSQLKSLYLMNSVACDLGNSSVFQNTPMTNSTYLGYFGSVYVPSSLLTTYKNKTYWKNISTRIVGM